MNKLEDIYNNVFENIKKFYSKEYNNAKGKFIIPITSIFDQYPKNYDGEEWIKNKNKIISSIMKDDKTNYGLYIGTYAVKDMTFNGNELNQIPVYILFTKINTEVNQYKILNIQSGIDQNIPCFIINIITHHFKDSNTSTISKSVLASEYFYRQFTYNEFSIDIFNHVWQPKFQLLNDEKSINDVTQKYLMDLSCMGSMFHNDPVNKRLLGLPKINTLGIVKKIPDVYRIFQHQGVNYRKVIASNSHNPFTK